MKDYTYINPKTGKTVYVDSEGKEHFWEEYFEDTGDFRMDVPVKKYSEDELAEEKLQVKKYDVREVKLTRRNIKDILKRTKNFLKK